MEKRIHSRTFILNVVPDGADPIVVKMRLFIDDEAKRVVGVRSLNVYDEQNQLRIKRYDTGTVDFLYEDDVEMVPPFENESR